MTAAPDAAARRLPPLLEAMRPQQWAKNVFVLAGVVFAGRLFDLHAGLRVLAAFAVFCAAASSVYLANDLADRESDAHHPEKRLRAIAAGLLQPATAAVASGALALAALAAAALLNRATFLLTLAYLASTWLYSFRLKRVFLLDVLILAAGFVLRAAAGAAVIDAQISPWLLVCTFLLALFLALGKRRSELVLLGGEAQRHRAALEQYSLPLLDSWLTALSGATMVCYTLYTQSERTVEHFGTTNLLYTVPFVIYALFRYQHLLLREGSAGEPSARSGGDPGGLLARDRGMWAALLGWAVTAACVIYW